MTIPFVDSSDLLAQPKLLRERMQANGYVFLRGVAPKEFLAALERQILELCRTCGWADERGESIAPVRVEGTPSYWDVYDRVQCLESFHALAHWPQVLALVETFISESVFVHPHKVARIVFPKTEQYTGFPHQDFIYAHGSPETYTIWLPLTDCPRELGALRVLAGSQRLPVIPLREAIESEVNLPGVWHGSDFDLGDALVFHSHTIHKASPNRTTRIRLSVDYRYQALSAPITSQRLEPHYGRLAWSTIYRDWSRKDLCYYWRDLPLHLVPRDAALDERVFR